MSKHGFHFDGFDSPNGTVVPDVFFDVLAPNCSEAELRCLIYIIRRTFGFKKNSDAISLSQLVDGITTRDGRVLDLGTGMSRKGVVRGCAGLVEKGIVVKESRQSDQGDNDINVYRLRFRTEQISEVSGVGNVGNYRREPNSLRVGNVGNPQQTGIQETDQQQTGKDSNENNSTVFLSKRDAASIELSTVVSTRRTQAVQPHSMTPTETFEEATAPTGWSRLADVAAGLRTRAPAPEGHRYSPGRGRPPKAPDYLATTMEELSGKLHDDNPRSSLTRAVKLWKATGLPEDKFVHRLHEAKSITQQQGSVKGKPAKDDRQLTNRMPYFFAVVEDLLGLKATAAEPS